MYTKMGKLKDIKIRKQKANGKLITPGNLWKSKKINLVPKLEYLTLTLNQYWCMDYKHGEQLK